MDLPAGVSYNIRTMRYDVTYPWLDNQPNKTVTYTEDFLYLSGDKGWANQFDTGVDSLVNAVTSAFRAAYPPAATVIGLACGALGQWVKYVMRDSHGGITLAFAPHWAGTVTGGIDLNYLGVQHWDTGMKALTQQLRRLNPQEQRMMAIQIEHLPTMDLRGIPPHTER